MTALRNAAAWARDCFQAANCDRLAAGLLRLIGVAVATRDSANGDERTAASALLADANIAAASLAVKLNDDAFGWGWPTAPPTAIPTPERQGRYWIDVARAYHHWARQEPCYRALLAAERAAPTEVCYRPPAHRIAAGLLRASSRQSLPGLRAFARRIGVPAI